MKTIQLGEVSLNVKNLKNQSKFYEDVIGLHIIEESDKKVDLGIVETGEVLVSLVQVNEDILNQRMTGLYHLALLLPTREALGGILRHLLEVKAPLIGASDHGYSEALYLQDPEGNGIEIYRDKERSSWDIREDGMIKGITIEMDATGVMLSSPGPINKIPKGTTMGHVHLTVDNLQDTVDFYQGVLGFTLTDMYGDQARFFAKDGYHHHIGTNNWSGTNILKRDNELPGIKYYTIIWETAAAFEALKQRLTELDIKIVSDNSNAFQITDPNGIIIHMELKK